MRNDTTGLGFSKLVVGLVETEGVAVGSYVTVGTVDGFGVGSDDGATEGCSDGSPLGTFEGAPVGVISDAIVVAASVKVLNCHLERPYSKRSLRI
jgi:hypothetical protein